MDLPFFVRLVQPLLPGSKPGHEHYLEELAELAAQGQCAFKRHSLIGSVRSQLDRSHHTISTSPIAASFATGQRVAKASKRRPIDRWATPGRCLATVFLVDLVFHDLASQAGSLANW